MMLQRNLLYTGIARAKPEQQPDSARPGSPLPGRDRRSGSLLRRKRTRSMAGQV
jgi:hypothetical protein